MGFRSFRSGIVKLLLLPLAVITFVLTASPASAAPASTGQGWSGVQWTTSVVAKGDAPIQINVSPSCDMQLGPLPGYYVDFFCSVPPLMVVHLHVICSAGQQGNLNLPGPGTGRIRAVCGPPFTVAVAWWD